MNNQFYNCTSVNQEINPQDVERLIREGKLRFGMELEFYGKDGWEGPHRFLGFDPDSDTKNFCGGHLWYGQARFPLPKLKDGDPVVCSSKKQHRKNCHRHFKEFIYDNGSAIGIMTWEDGKTNWGSKSTGGSVWEEWRLPTLQELQSAGYSEAQISDLRERRCVG